MIFHIFLFGLGLKETKTDLKIGIRRKGNGCSKYVTDQDSVYAHVVARIDGNDKPIFDTHALGKPLHFKADEPSYIKGFTQGILGACEGEIRRITIPPELAYKGESVEGLFGPHSTWVVDVEILEIVRSTKF